MNNKINYQKHYGPTGTVYNQTITINDKMATEFNKYLEEKKEETSKKFIYTNEDMQLFTAESLDLGINFTNLRTLDQFIAFYHKNYINGPKKDKFFERLLYRNTIIQVI